jgi:hypothetical protein
MWSIIGGDNSSPCCQFCPKITDGAYWDHSTTDWTSCSHPLCLPFYKAITGWSRGGFAATQSSAVPAIVTIVKLLRACCIYQMKNLRVYLKPELELNEIYIPFKYQALLILYLKSTFQISISNPYFKFSGISIMKIPSRVLWLILDYAAKIA